MFRLAEVRASPSLSRFTLSTHVLFFSVMGSHRERNVHQRQFGGTISVCKNCALEDEGRGEDAGCPTRHPEGDHPARSPAQTSGIILAIGLSSLPDDVIARVFELYYEDLCKTRPPEIASFSSPIVLASICKHFRRIALHLPRLWEGVSFKFGPDWISCLKERCQHPAVFLEDMNIRKPFRSLLQLLHPIDQWKGLHIKYTGEEEGHKIFKNICPVTRESFKELHTLTIDRNQYDYFLELEDSDAQLTTMLSEDDHELLKKLADLGT